MLTVEQIDQIAAGIRDSIGANAKPIHLNRARVQLSCILAHLAETDLDVLNTAHRAAMGRLSRYVPAKEMSSEVANDACDSMHTEFLLLAPAYVLRDFAHKRNHHKVSGTSAIISGPISMNDMPDGIREAFDELRRRAQSEPDDDDEDQ